MAYVVIAYPSFAAADRARIEALRALHDDHVTVVKAHITFVFPWHHDNLQAVIEHVAQVAKQHSRFRFCLTEAIVYHDRLASEHYAFLVPGAGLQSMHALHDALYTGPLADELINDIAYQPHVRVGNFADAHACAAVVHEVNSTAIEMWASIDTIELAHYDGEHVVTVQAMSLQ